VGVAISMSTSKSQLGVGLGDGLGLGDGVGLGDGLGEGDGLGDGLGEGVGVGVDVGIGVGKIISSSTTHELLYNNIVVAV
jgi:hypothetical protein